MKSGKEIYGFSHILAAIAMILALLWLTVSAPVIFSAQQKLVKASQELSQNNFPETEEDGGNPFGNNTEEKAPGGISFAEEFLHEYQQQIHLFTASSSVYAIEEHETYHAYHGELLVPPPNRG